MEDPREETSQEQGTPQEEEELVKDLEPSEAEGEDVRGGRKAGKDQLE